MDSVSASTRAEAKSDAGPGALEQRYLWIVVAGVALATSLAMVFVVFGKQEVVPTLMDPYDYGKIAHGFVEHGFNKLTRRSASLYPTFLSIVYQVGGTDFVIQLIQCALFAGTCALVYKIGEKVHNARTGLIAGLICAFHPMFLRYVPDLHMETWLTFWCTLTIWRAIKFDERPTIVNAILLGVVGVIGTLSKGIILPILLAYGAVWLVRAIRRKNLREAFPPLAALGLTIALLIAPWTYRNYKVSGTPVLLTPGTADSFLRGYIFTRLEFATLRKPPYTDAENESNNLFRKIAADAGTTWEKDEVQDEINNGRVMRRWIVERPLDTIRKVVVGLFTFWYEMTSLKNSLVPASLAIVSWIFAFIGLKRARKEGEPAWLLLLPIIVLNVFVAALIPLGRYSVPILPCLSILAAFGVDTLLARRTGSAAAAA